MLRDYVTDTLNFLDRASIDGQLTQDDHTLTLLGGAINKTSSRALAKQCFPHKAQLEFSVKSVTVHLMNVMYGCLQVL